MTSFVSAKSDEKCSITLEPIVDLARAGNCVSTSCGHKFSKEEIIKWRDEHGTCPVCRQEIDVLTPVMIATDNVATDRLKNNTPANQPSNTSNSSKINSRAVVPLKNRNNILERASNRNHVDSCRDNSTNSILPINISFKSLRILNFIRYHIALNKVINECFNRSISPIEKCDSEVYNAKNNFLLNHTIHHLFFIESLMLLASINNVLTATHNLYNNEPQRFFIKIF